MTAHLSSRTQQVLAVGISKLDAVYSHGGKQAVWAGLQEHIWHGMTSRCRLSVFMLQPGRITQGPTPVLVLACSYQSVPV